MIDPIGIVNCGSALVGTEDSSSSVVDVWGIGALELCKQIAH